MSSSLKGYRDGMKNLEPGKDSKLEPELPVNSGELDTTCILL